MIYKVITDKLGGVKASHVQVDDNEKQPFLGNEESAKMEFKVNHILNHTHVTGFGKIGLNAASKVF